MIAKDYIDQELSVGDHVIYVQLGYRNFVKGTITKITRCFVFLKQDGQNESWRKDTEIKQGHSQVIKIPCIPST